MHKELRKQIVLKRKNFLPSLIITILLFISLVSIVYFTNPKYSIFTVLFFINLFTFLFFVFSLIFISSKKGFIISLCVTILAILKMLT